MNLLDEHHSVAVNKRFHDDSWPPSITLDDAWLCRYPRESLERVRFFLVLAAPLNFSSNDLVDTMGFCNFIWLSFSLPP